MSAGASGLYSVRRNRLVSNYELQPPLFGDFRVWVLERWRFTPEDQCFGHSALSEQKDYINSGFISEHHLEDFLLRKRHSKFKLDMQPTGPRFRGRLRLMFSLKRNDAAPSLAMRQSDFDLVERELKLHPSTSQYIRRSMKASRFWGPNKSNFKSRFTNGLITELDDSYNGPQVDDFKLMLDASPELWPHPLLVPILLLDMLMDNLEASIIANIKSIKETEDEVSSLPSLDMDTKPLAERTNVTGLLKKLHNTNKTAIKLLDAASWMDKVVMMLSEIGDELDKTNNNTGIDGLWVELQAFLEDLGRITDHLKPDPVMTQQRCMSQIDILNNKIAQEDNLLAARMAVSATRDSSAMKALAVITALFLPGTYIATLFSMSMFNWQGGGNSSTPAASNGTVSSDTASSTVVMPYIWIYGVVSAVLTIVVILGWRLWWVMQDRDFRRDLPRGVQNDGPSLATKDGKNALPRSFFEDVVGFGWPKRKKT